MTESGTYPFLPIMVVDDDPGSSLGLQIALKSMGMTNLAACPDGRAAIRRLAASEIEVILLDLLMPGLSGEEVLNIVMRDQPDVPVIVVTATDELDTAVRCIRAGAFDYLVKPVSRERLSSSVRRAIEMRNLRRENLRLREHVLSGELRHPEAFAGFDACSDAMRSLFRYVESIADSQDPVLITGETGTGKELMARCVHVLSGRKGHYVAVNVAGLDEQAFSDTLFGHRKGAFTGATENRGGLVERAAGGSLFLDEIGDLGVSFQVKLLRLLQEREYFPLGSDVPCRTDARVIVATNRPVDELRISEQFRKDLYFRLCHHHVDIPPLRERMQDMPLLAARFLGECSSGKGDRRPVVPDAALDLLRQYSFPGNVRELRAMVGDGVRCCQAGGKIPLKFFSAWIEKNRGPAFLPPPRAGALGVDKAWNDGIAWNSGTSLPTLREIQKRLVIEALKRAGDNQALAAKMLGITRQALNRRIRSNREKSPESPD